MSFLVAGSIGKQKNHQWGMGRLNPYSAPTSRLSNDVAQSSHHGATRGRQDMRGGVVGLHTSQSDVFTREHVAQVKIRDAFDLLNHEKNAQHLSIWKCLCLRLAVLDLWTHLNMLDYNNN